MTTCAWGINKTDRFKVDAFQKKNKMLENVSPVSYERHLKDKKDLPKWSMGSKLTELDKRVSPGPSVYDIPSKMVEKSGKTFGLKIMGFKDTTNAPGPGAYTQDKAKLDNVQYSMAAKLQMQKSLQVPGPGTYEQKKETLMDKAAEYKFGTGSRTKMELANARVVPGSGSYSPDYKTLKKASPRFGFGSQVRADTVTERKKFIPGPGNYAHMNKTGQEGRQSSIHAKIGFSPAEKEQSFKPGPGNYEPNPYNTKKKEPQYKIGTGERLDLQFSKRQKFQQDPGSYNPDFAVTKDAASQWKFGTDTRKEVVNKNAKNFPGAGSYQIPSKIVEGAQYGMALKLGSSLSQSPMKNPGPGEYDLQNKDNGNMLRSNKYSIGTSSRGNVVAKGILHVPGPGNYASSLFDKSKAPNYGFGTGGRDKMNQTTKVPGPGQYELGNLTGREGPQNSMHNKLVYKPIQSTGGLTPGPGNYDSPLGMKKRAPSYGLGSDQRKFNVPKAILAIPASNTYNPNSTFTQKSASKWIFGTEQRQPPQGIDRIKSPGPGGYEIKPKDFQIEKARFHVGQKFSPLKPTTAVPGAGSYDPTPEKTKKQLPSYSMKLKLESCLTNKSAVPGAGTYESSLKTKQEAPKYGFGSGTRDTGLRKLNVPGPGAYRLNSSIGDVPAYSMPNRAPEDKYV